MTWFNATVLPNTASLSGILRRKKEARVGYHFATTFFGLVATIVVMLTVCVREQSRVMVTGDAPKDPLCALDCFCCCVMHFFFLRKEFSFTISLRQPYHLPWYAHGGISNNCTTQHIHFHFYCHGPISFSSWVHAFLLFCQLAHKHDWWRLGKMRKTL